jgi:hypothetical protein
MDTAPSTSSYCNRKTFRVSNLAVDEMCEILQACDSEQSDIDIGSLSVSEYISYPDTDREPEVDRHEIDDVEVVSFSTKTKKLNGFGPRAKYTGRATSACWRSSANFCG